MFTELSTTSGSGVIVTLGQCALPHVLPVSSRSVPGSTSVPACSYFSLFFKQFIVSC